MEANLDGMTTDDEGFNLVLSPVSESTPIRWEMVKMSSAEM